MSNNQLAVFNFNQYQVRVITDDQDAPWFVAKDICEALGYKNVSDAISNNLDIDERSTIANPDSRNGGGSLLIINESGLFTLILRSNKPEARPFRKLVTSEILPAIRRTGSYKAAQSTDIFDHPQHEAALDELCSARPLWRDIVKFKSMNLSHAQIGLLTRRAVSTVRHHVRRMEAVGLIKPPLDLAARQIQAQRLQIGGGL